MVKIGDRLGVHLFERWVSPPTLTVAPRRRDRNREARYTSKTVCTLCEKQDATKNQAYKVGR